MNTNVENSKPTPKAIAQQLRKPSGEAANNVAELMDKVNEPLFELMLRKMPLRPGEKVLEIGFGSGRYLARLLEKVKKLDVSGVDYSKEMVDLANQNNQDIIDAGCLDLQLGKSDDLPYPDAIFDKVYCNMVIYFWDDPHSHLKEVLRVLKPGGQFFTGMRTKGSMLQFPFVQHGFTLYDQRQWLEILKEHGFVYLETHAQTDPLLEQQEKSIQMESLCIVGEKMDPNGPLKYD